MPTDDTARRHARLFSLIHQQARAEYTALRLKRRADRPLTRPDADLLMAVAVKSWSAGAGRPARPISRETR